MSLLTTIKQTFKPSNNKLALVFFSASLGLLALFLGKIYSDNNDSPTPVFETKQDQNIAINEQVDTVAINELTSQLLTERQITEDLHAQNQELMVRLQETTTKLSTSDSNYLSALNTLNKSDSSISIDKKTLEGTDYYNKVSLESIKQNNLQSQINQFIDNNGTKENIYFETLKVESFIRENEVRSIVLKRGESIWMLAKRAYGTGFSYHKIMKANPHITEKSAKYLKPGTIIRVPK